MRTLFQLSLASTAEHIDSPHVGPLVHLLPPYVKTLLLDRVLSHDFLTVRSRSHVVQRDFFKDLHRLVLPCSDVMDDRFMTTIAGSGSKLNEIYLSVPMIPNDERRAKLTGRGVSALLGTQDALEVLTLFWCVNFKQGVLNRVRSDRLRTVEIHGDAVCSCFANSGEYKTRNEEIQLYQRDVSFLAINNRTITRLHLDSVILNIGDCHSLISALADSLEHLVIKIVRYYQYCDGDHCFYGRDFVPFMEMVDTKCTRLRYLSCYCYKTDLQRNRQLRLRSKQLETLSLEGHVFDAPLLLPCNIRKLKLSLNGWESSEHFDALTENWLPNLERVYIHFVENYTVADESGLMALFSYLGPKIVSITDVNAVVFNHIAFCIGEFCPNLKTLGVLRSSGANATGVQLLTLIGDEARAARLKHLRLTLDNASQSLLSMLAANCVNLRTLDVAYCRAMDDAILSQVAINCSTNLRTLDVSYCRAITDESVKSVAINCSYALEELCMLETGVGDDGIRALATHCPRLRICRYNEKTVSPEMTKKLRQSCVDRVISVGNSMY